MKGCINRQCSRFRSRAVNLYYETYVLMNYINDLAYLILVKNLAVVKVSMGEDPIDATANRAQFGHR